MQKITHELYQAAMKNGYRMDIGQLSLSERRALDKQVKEGKIAKCIALWPYLMTGFREKTCYVYLEECRKVEHLVSGCDGGCAA
jgi:hypothetical protein